MTEPSSPALIAIWRAGADSALRTISTPVFWSSFLVRIPLRCSEARSRATPPPGTMPSSTAARVACIASSTRSLRSLTSTSVAPPTRTTAQTVDDEGGESLAFDVFRDDDERLAGLHHGFQERKQFVQAGELLLVDQDVGVVELNAHLVGVGDEVGRDVAAVELHAFDDLKLGFERLGFFNRDDALVADLLHGVG